MSAFDVIMVSTLGVLYLALVLTLAVQTYRKGYTWLFVGGFLIPVLWMVGAVLRARPGSEHARREREYWSRQGG